MSPRWLLSLCASAILSCAETEPAELPPSSPLAEPGAFESTRTIQMDEAEDVYEDQLRADKRSTLTMSTALLHEIRDRRGEPELLRAVGMAVLEITQRGIELHITAELEPGTHQIHLLEQVTPCNEITAESPRHESFGQIEHATRSRASFERRIEGGMDEYEWMVGHPLVLVETSGKSTVCGVFRETSVPSS